MQLFRGPQQVILFIPIISHNNPNHYWQNKAPTLIVGACLDVVW